MHHHSNWLFSALLQPVTMALDYPPLEYHPLKNTICLFDVDYTLTPARRVSPHLCNEYSALLGLFLPLGSSPCMLFF